MNNISELEKKLDDPFLMWEGLGPDGIPKPPLGANGHFTRRQSLQRYQEAIAGAELKIKNWILNEQWCELGEFLGKQCINYLTGE